MTYICDYCNNENTKESAYVNDGFDVNLREEGYCIDCAGMIGFCESCEQYSFAREDTNSIKECRLCKECADERFSGPNSDDPDFWDSYDPDW